MNRHAANLSTVKRIFQIVPPQNSNDYIHPWGEELEKCRRHLINPANPNVSLKKR